MRTITKLTGHLRVDRRLDQDGVSRVDKSKNGLTNNLQFTSHMKKKVPIYLMYDILRPRPNREPPPLALLTVVLARLQPVHPLDQRGQARGRAVLQALRERSTADLGRELVPGRRARLDRHRGEREGAWVRLAREHGDHARAGFERVEAAD